MIIVNLKGGLGNQMFQYAFGRKLSLKNNDELKLDIEGLERANKIGDIYRPFSLGRFNLKKAVATPEEVRRLKYPYGIFSKAWRWFNSKILKQTNVLWNPKALNREGNLFIDGYWQSPKYFEDIRDVLLTDFTLTESLGNYGENVAFEMKNSNSVSIHVRRGDYIKNPQVLKEFGICSDSYYQKSISLIKSKVSNPKFFIFSDDISWVKENLEVGENAVFVNNPELTDTAELFLMSQCKNNIIANSTFSWWAAWINKNPNKLVISPDPWFESAEYDTTLIPDSWIQIPKN